MSDHPYQITPQVVQLQAERMNAAAYGNEPRVAEIDRRLADLGVKAEAAQERKVAAEVSEGTERHKPPQGRTGRPRQST